MLTLATSVAGNGFGSGSSREDAVRALQGAGIEAVIAKSFAFICTYHLNSNPWSFSISANTRFIDERNQINMGLYNIIMKDPLFYEHATEDASISIDKDRKVISIEGVDREFPYSISTLEETLLDTGGVVSLYKKFDKALFRHLVSLGSGKKRAVKSTSTSTTSGATGCEKSGGPTLDW